MQRQRTAKSQLRSLRLQRTVSMVCLIVVAVGSIVQRWFH